MLRFLKKHLLYYFSFFMLFIIFMVITLTMKNIK